MGIFKIFGIFLQIFEIFGIFLEIVGIFSEIFEIFEIFLKIFEIFEIFFEIFKIFIVEVTEIFSTYLPLGIYSILLYKNCRTYVFVGSTKWWENRHGQLHPKLPGHF